MSGSFPVDELLDSYGACSGLSLNVGEEMKGSQGFIE